MTNLDRIHALLKSALSPERLEVIDESAAHAGHAGVVEGKTTHVRVRVVAEAFRGLSRIERHRRVNNLLEGEIAAGLHAIAIEAKAPEE
jgi:BolA protein